MTTEALIRVGSFITMLIVMGTAESLFPRRILDAAKTHRWFSNITISTLSSLLVRIAFPVIPAGLAIYCVQNDLGLLNQISLPNWLSFLLTILLLDMIIYWQHVLFHKQRWLWRIHRMHHADVNIDASTGIRFHPIEIILSMVIKLTAIVIIGPPPQAVIAFEVVLNACALFNHANVRLPLSLDRLLRLFLVTPDMHRVHHSTDMREANTNFGFNLPWWDRLFGTYKAQPALGHQGMHIGLNIFRDPKYIRLSQMLAIPFR